MTRALHLVVIFRTHVEFNMRQVNGVTHKLVRVTSSHASSHVYDDVPSCIRDLIANELFPKK